MERFREDKRVERKSARIHAKELGDYFSIYANRQPHGGVIFVGVMDNGDVEGCSSLGDARLNELERAGSIHCLDARAISKSIPAYNKSGKPDFIIAIRVFYRHDKLVETVRGEGFTREESSKRKDAFDQALVHEYATNYAVSKRLNPSPGA